jgi:hypothetical protein
MRRAIVIAGLAILWSQHAFSQCGVMPTVDFRWTIMPAPSRILDDTELQISSVSTQSPISAFRFVVNGKERLAVSGAEFITVENSYSYKADVKIGPLGSSAPLKLDRGDNDVTVIAETASGCRGQRELRIQGGDSGVRAVVVGISAYQHVSELLYARKDAEQFAGHLRTQFADSVQPILLTDSSAEREVILKALESEARWVAKGGTLIFYFSGHGAVYETPQKELQAYLVPFKGKAESPADITSTGIYREQWLQAMNWAVGNKIFILDSCFSGLLPGEKPAVLSQGNAKGLAGSLEHRISGRLPALYTMPPGVLGFTSSSGTDVSYEIADLEHGLFTYYLLESASVATDRDIAYADAVRYMRREMSLKYPGLQAPALWLNPDTLGDIVWARRHQ